MKRNLNDMEEEEETWDEDYEIKKRKIRLIRRLMSAEQIKTSSPIQSADNARHAMNIIKRIQELESIEKRMDMETELTVLDKIYESDKQQEEETPKTKT